MSVYTVAQLSILQVKTTQDLPFIMTECITNVAVLFFMHVKKKSSDYSKQYVLSFRDSK